MAINSREKGKRGELSVAHLFQEYGFKAERGQQHDGRSGHADVVGVPRLWIEVKRNETLNIDEAMKQAERDCLALDDDDVIPVVIHRKNLEKWKVTMRLFNLLFMCGTMPFSTTMNDEGLVTMRFDEWIDVFLDYNERCENDIH